MFGKKTKSLKTELEECKKSLDLIKWQRGIIQNGLFEANKKISFYENSIESPVVLKEKIECLENLLNRGIEIYLKYNLHRKRKLANFDTVFNALKEGNYVLGEYFKDCVINNTYYAYDLSTLQKYTVLNGYYTEFVNQDHKKNVIYQRKDDQTSYITDFNHEYFYIY